MRYERLAARIRSMSHELGSGASADSVKEAEKVLSVRFPYSYKAFLLEFGWGSFWSREVYGLGSDVPAYLDVVKITLSERTEMRPRIPVHLVPICNDGGGNHYCLNTREMSGDECSVVFWDHTLNERQQPEKYSEDFVDWLNSWLDRGGTDA